MPSSSEAELEWNRQLVSAIQHARQKGVVAAMPHVEVLAERAPSDYCAYQALSLLAAFREECGMLREAASALTQAECLRGLEPLHYLTIQGVLSEIEFQLGDVQSAAKRCLMVANHSSFVPIPNVARVYCGIARSCSLDVFSDEDDAALCRYFIELLKEFDLAEEKGLLVDNATLCVAERVQAVLKQG